MIRWDNSNYLMHYGMPRRSGRYPYGSGKNPRASRRTSNSKSQTVFVSGSSKTQNPDSIYFRKKLPKQVTDQLDEHMNNKKRIIVGDAPGIDRQVQNYLKSKNYNNVELYGPGQQIRYAANKNWKQNLIDAPEYEPGSKEWLAKKDVAMTNAATEGLAIVLKDGANATRRNVSRLMSQNKKVKVYELNDQGEALDRFMSDREIRRIMKMKINKI